MPPRTVKKRAAGPGMKRAAAARGTPKAKKQPEFAEESPKVEEVSVEVEEVKVVEVIEDKSKDNRVSEPEAKQNSEILASLQHEDEVKDSLDEDLKGEQLDLEGNEPEYDPEEFVGGDYDDNGVEQENVQEEGDEVEEEAEGASEEEDGDMEEDEMESVAEELECEVGEEHANMVAAEEKEHHEVVKERRKRKEYEIFVGGLDKDATEHDLRKVFSKVGEVTEVRLMMSSLTKKNKGFAFLRFATVQQAKRAYTELKNPVVNGKQCGVTPSQDSDTLFLGNICNTWRKETLKEKLKHYGVEIYEDLTLVEDSNNEGMNRGFAFLEFSSRSDAMDASKRLQKRDVVFGVDRPAKVSFTDSYIDPGDEIMAQVKTVFVDGLPASWDEDRVRKLLRNFGKIEKIELARNMTSAKRKDFGFVTFDTHDAAVSCAKSINNEELGEGESKAKVRARLSRPRQRGKGKRFDRDSRAGHGITRGDRGPWRRPVPRILPVQGTRRTGSRLPLPADRRLKRPVGFMERVERRPVMVMPTRRSRPVARSSRSYERRPPPPVPVHPKSSLKRDYGRRDEFPPRGRASAEYASRLALERDQSYRDDYYSHGSGYSDLPRTSSRTAARRSYADDGHDPRFEKPYREGVGRDYDLKRPYNALDDAPSRFADAGVRQSRARLDYELSGSSSQYVDEYSDRLGRSSLGYVSSRTSLSTQDSHGLYNGRQGSFSGGDVGGTYSSSYGRDYMSRGSDAGGIPYSSMYSDRGLGGSRYMGNGESRSYY